MTVHWDGTIPLTHLLDHVRPAYGGTTWDEAIAYLNNDPAEAAVIADLIRLAPTGFTEPVRLVAVDRDDDDEDDPDPYARPWRIGNGMHRVAAATAMGHDTINVTTAASLDDGTGTDPTYVEVRFRMPGNWPDTTTSPVRDEASEDAMDYICGWLRSFPLPDDTWVETDIIAGHGDIYECLWACPPTHAHMLLAELARRYPPIDIVEWRTVTGTELDAEYEATASA